MLHVFGSICPYEKLMYGSENPFLRDFPDQMRAIRKAAEEHGYEPISEDDLEGIMGKNAARLYDIDTEDYSEANRPEGSEDQ
jgi:predicted TIM-barrel fold metal-dependent hydrolase